jgi:hypothetical protein
MAWLCTPFPYVCPPVAAVLAYLAKATIEENAAYCSISYKVFIQLQTSFICLQGEVIKVGRGAKWHRHILRCFGASDLGDHPPA